MKIRFKHKIDRIHPADDNITVSDILISIDDANEGDNTWSPGESYFTRDCRTWEHIAMAKPILDEMMEKASKTKIQIWEELWKSIRLDTRREDKEAKEGGCIERVMGNWSAAY